MDPLEREYIPHTIYIVLCKHDRMILGHSWLNSQAIKTHKLSQATM